VCRAHGGSITVEDGATGARFVATVQSEGAPRV
jgi:hypothetical protein